MNHAPRPEPALRLCTPQDLDGLMRLQEAVCQGLTDPSLFVPTSREDNAGYLRLPHRIIGAFAGERLVAYCSLVFPGAAPDNLGWDLGWPPQRVQACAMVDTVAVDAAFRGMGLQRNLVRRALEEARGFLPDTFLLTTVSPRNVHSLRNMQGEGFEILLQTQKYGGLDRLILGRPARSPK